MEYMNAVKTEPLDLRVAWDPRVWVRPLCPQPLRVPLAEPSPEWTFACKPHAPQAEDIVKTYLGLPPLTSERDTGFEDRGSLSDDPEFLEYKHETIRVMTERNGGSIVGHNPRMRRSVLTSLDANEAYRRRRERNNVAAKQSRDRRKLRELHSTLKVGFLKKKIAESRSLLARNKCDRCKRLPSFV